MTINSLFLQEQGIETGKGQARVALQCIDPAQQVIPTTPGTAGEIHVRMTVPICEGAQVFDNNGNEVILPSGSEVRVGFSRAGSRDLVVLAGQAHTWIYNAYPPEE